jgi:hypothetical protein
MAALIIAILFIAAILAFAYFEDRRVHPDNEAPPIIAKKRPPSPYMAWESVKDGQQARVEIPQWIPKKRARPKKQVHIIDRKAHPFIPKNRPLPDNPPPVTPSRQVMRYRQQQAIKARARRRAG